MLKKMTVRDLSQEQLGGKRVLMRVDYNVPLDEAGQVAEDERIRATLPSLAYLAGRGARIVLMSHLGRPNGVRVPSLTLRPVATCLANLFDSPVEFSPSTTSKEVVAASRQLEPGSVLLVENTRFDPGEVVNDPTLAAAMAALGDLYVNDAFGTAHRAHASIVGVARQLQPAVAGLLMERELENLGALLVEPARPFVAVLGGGKASGKLSLIGHLLDKVDRLCVGGAMACTFFRAMGYAVGKSPVEEDLIEVAEALMRRAGEALVLPNDVVVAHELRADAETAIVASDQIPEDRVVADIGPLSAEEFSQVILGARTILWNGPVGVFELEPFAAGTQAIAAATAEATQAGGTSVVGGGDTAAAASAFGLLDRMSHVSTGGGAVLEFLAGEVLPGVSVLTDRQRP